MEEKSMGLGNRIPVAQVKPIADLITKRAATFDAERIYRYDLTREWAGGAGYLGVIGLNPSTADESIEDPTIRREIGFAIAWGYHGLLKGNLFALRATDPEELYRHPAPTGRENDDALFAIAKRASVIVVAWGVHGAFCGRGDAVSRMLSAFPLKCFGRTKDGHPKHPLYLSSSTRLEDWRRP